MKIQWKFWEFLNIFEAVGSVGEQIFILVFKFKFICNIIKLLRPPYLLAYHILQSDMYFS